MNNLSMPVMPAVGRDGFGPSGREAPGCGNDAFGETLGRAVAGSGGVSERATAPRPGDGSRGSDDPRAACSCRTTEGGPSEGAGLPGMPPGAVPLADAFLVATWMPDLGMSGEPSAMPVGPGASQSGFFLELGRWVFAAARWGEVVLQGPGSTPDDALLSAQHGRLENAAATATPDTAVLLQQVVSADPETARLLADAVSTDSEHVACEPGALKEPAVPAGAESRGLRAVLEGFAVPTGVALPRGRAQGAPAETAGVSETAKSGGDAGPETPDGGNAPVSNGPSAADGQRAVRDYGIPDSLQQIRRVGSDGQGASLGDPASGVTARGGGASAMDGTAQVPIPSGEEDTLHDLADQVRAQLRVMAARGRERVTLQLHPASLGKLKLQVSLEKQSVVAEMMTESGAVRDLVHAQLQTLRESLAEQGFQLERFVVHLQDDTAGQGPRDGGSAFREAFRESLGRRPDGDAQHSQPPSVDVPGVESVTPEGRVNLFV